ncbi:MAG: sulfurtransferase [Halothermotrichaceae bacterium]
MRKISILLLVITALVLTFTACTTTEAPGEKGEAIISAKKALDIIADDEVVLVDAQKSSAYGNEHIEGAVNISRSDITTFIPVPNIMASAKKVGEVLGKKGISKDSKVIVYDNNNNMDASRLWWTMKVFGHEDVKVISGGLKALVKAGGIKTTAVPEVTAVDYTTEKKNEELIASKEEVKSQVNNPRENVVLLDVRTEEEYTEGTIPASVHLNYEYNNFDDGTFRPVRQIHTLYRDKDITPDKTIIMYCKTSIRAAQTYVALYNAGYRNLKIYDGAWVEWSADSSLPVETPEGTETKVNFQDGS